VTNEQGNPKLAFFFLLNFHSPSSFYVLCDAR
jgi:hypothetical protein